MKIQSDFRYQTTLQNRSQYFILFVLLESFYPVAIWFTLLVIFSKWH